MADFSTGDYISSKVRNLGSLISDELRLDFLLNGMARFPVAYRLLDLGCGTQPYAQVYQPWAKNAYAVDVPFTAIIKTRLDAFSDAQFLPFANHTYDVVICTEVMEHIPDPSRMLSEIHRILTGSGRLYLTTPFLMPEHDAPYDYYRYTRFGLEYLLHQHGFQVAIMEQTGDLFGVSVMACVRYQLKFWHAVAKKLQLGSLATVNNPLVWLGVWLPQKVYVFLFKKAVHFSDSFLGKLHKVFAYGCLGYSIVAIKDHPKETNDA
jgi:SAM-dependent methyltransferase